MLNPGKALVLLGLLLVLLASPAGLHAQQQRVDVQLSANRVTVDESVILNVRAYALDKEIDYSALSENFDVSKRSSSRQVTLDNGKRTSLVEWVLELVPKQTGVLEIAPIKVGDEQSRVLSVLVEPSPTGASRELYLEAGVDVAQPFVQAQVLYTLRVFQDVRFINASLQVPEVDGVVIQQLADENTYQETVNGRDYVVREIRYSIFPQHSGVVVIPPMSLQAVVPVNAQQMPNTRTRTKRLTRRSNQIELNVQARPEGLAGSWWLPAKEVQLQSEWSEPIDQLNVDQPVTRTIHLMATGVGDAQLPEIDVPMIDNISVYADSPTAATNTSIRGLMSQQTNTWAVIPQTAGSLILPEVRVNWFDTTIGEARVAVLPEETLTVVDSSAATGTNAAQGNSNSQANDAQQVNIDSDALAEQPRAASGTGSIDGATPPTSNTDALGNMVNHAESALVQRSLGRWRNAAFAAMAGWLLSLLCIWIWWRRRANNNSATDAQAPTETTSMRFQRRAGSNAALAAIRQASETGDASKIAKSVLAWGAMVWPDAVPTHIAEVAKRLQSVPLKVVFDGLDAQQFRSAGSVNSVAVESIPELLKEAVNQYQAEEPELATSRGLPSL